MSAARAKLLFDTGNAHDSHGAWDAAARAFAACADFAPGNEAALVNLGNTLVKAGRTAEAIAAYRRCLEVAPGNIDVRFNLGNALTGAGHLTEAVEVYVACRHCQVDWWGRGWSGSDRLGSQI
ncbi:MAG: tetratricopeptide repeat protein [Acidiphilium sp.]|nr:tetratricopeptide repeat protein [Acidiphilium sp.]MDD4935832.1 tetratricopeptide repeat protein [Acidiphilium sp.]